MIVALFTNASKKQAPPIALEIYRYLKSEGAEVVMSEDCMCIPEAKPLSSVPASSIDFVICLGGDGTILRAIQQSPEVRAPVMAINLGSLGFMADIPVDGVQTSLEHLIKGEFSIHERVMMEATVNGKHNCLAVNDITVHRGPTPSLVELSVFVDDHYLNSFTADGIIIATPSGSTAYSLSAGGPIVAPTVDALVLTPICPHTLSNRPIVLKPKDKIRICNPDTQDALPVDYDGFSDFQLEPGQNMDITISEKRFSLIKMPEHDYFATLRSKLGWSGKFKMTDRE